MGPRHWVPVLGLAQVRVWPKVSAAQRLLPPIRFWPPRRTFRTIGALFHARFYNWGPILSEFPPKLDFLPNAYRRHPHS